MIQCKATVPAPGVQFYRPKQCSRKAVKDGWCGQHHPDAREDRRKKAALAFEAKREQSPYRIIERLTERNKALTDALHMMRAQHFCGCGHPVCNRCADTASIDSILALNGADHDS